MTFYVTHIDSEKKIATLSAEPPVEAAKPVDLGSIASALGLSVGSSYSAQMDCKTGQLYDVRREG